MCLRARYKSRSVEMRLALVMGALVRPSGVPPAIEPPSRLIKKNRAS